MPCKILCKFNKNYQFLHSAEKEDRLSVEGGRWKEEDGNMEDARRLEDGRRWKKIGRWVDWKIEGWKIEDRRRLEDLFISYLSFSYCCNFFSGFILICVVWT
ncbi:hypothetical protein [Flavobacterium antarcticum]|uniref:hypothetical protein n=1 Tax=Flavobacterium antarcticum TaxID=271155 RepID=UPI0012FBC89A